MKDSKGNDIFSVFCFVLGFIMMIIGVFLSGYSTSDKLLFIGVIFVVFGILGCGVQIKTNVKMKSKQE